MKKETILLNLLVILFVAVCIYVMWYHPQQQGHRLNSPNDLAFSKRGDVYFTDPPYGFPTREKNPLFTAGHGFGGVYRVRREAIDAARVGGTGVPDGSEATAAAAAEPDLMENGAGGILVSIDFCSVSDGLSNTAAALVAAAEPVLAWTANGVRFLFWFWFWLWCLYRALFCSECVVGGIKCATSGFASCSTG